MATAKQSAKAQVGMPAPVEKDPTVIGDDATAGTEQNPSSSTAGADLPPTDIRERPAIKAVAGALANVTLNFEILTGGTAAMSAVNAAAAMIAQRRRNEAGGAYFLIEGQYIAIYLQGGRKIGRIEPPSGIKEGDSLSEMFDAARESPAFNAVVERYSKVAVANFTRKRGEKVVILSSDGQKYMIGMDGYLV